MQIHLSGLLHGFTEKIGYCLNHVARADCVPYIDAKLSFT